MSTTTTATTTAPPIDPTLHEQPPTTSAPQQAYDTASTSSVGPVIGVLAMITLLGVVAGMIGRLCSGRSIMGYGHFDVESWMESKCASCLDGYMDPPQGARPPPEPVVIAQPRMPMAVPSGAPARVERVEEVQEQESPTRKGVTQDDSESEDDMDDEEEHDSEHFHQHSTSNTSIHDGS